MQRNAALVSDRGQRFSQQPVATRRYIRIDRAAPRLRMQILQQFCVTDSLL